MGIVVEEEVRMQNVRLRYAGSRVLKKFRVNIPEGESGAWKVERSEVSQEEANTHNLRCAINGRTRMTIEPGMYTRLTRSGQVIMSDTPAEYNSHLEAIHKAKGQVLVNGLGLGVVIDAMLDKRRPDMSPIVQHLTAIEISEDVIALVSSVLLEKYGDRLEIVHADALVWRPPKNVRYDVVWHDIWDEICSDNKKTMVRLHRCYGRRCTWQGSWARYDVFNPRPGY